MHLLIVRNVHEALPTGIDFIDRQGVPKDSRNGPVLVAASPVTTMYLEPRERVMFWEDRDCNPFFHLMESLWMLAGRNDTAFVCKFVATMQNFSDDGKTFHGAYGYRWRKHFGMDQLVPIIEALKANKEDRRQVLGMWDPAVDLGKQGKDFPCNTQVYFAINAATGALDMTVCNRSNDVIWGAYGANAVHFSYLQEYMAACIGVEVGKYWQISNNFHAYLKTYNPLKHLGDMRKDPHRSATNNPYESGEVKPYPLISTDKATWDMDLEMFMSEGPVLGARDPFFRRVANPVYMAHKAYKEGKGIERYDDALLILKQCEASDWRKACSEWIERRKAKFLLKPAVDDGVSHDIEG